MQIIQPSKWVYDCHCECGARFIATDQDFESQKIVMMDPYWDDHSYSHTTTAYLDVLKCPCCNRFVCKIPSSFSEQDNTLKESDIPEVDKVLQKTDERFKFYTKFHEENFNKIKVEIKSWDEIPALREKYKFARSEEIL